MSGEIDIEAALKWADSQENETCQECGGSSYGPVLSAEVRRLRDTNAVLLTKLEDRGGGMSLAYVNKLERRLDYYRERAVKAEAKLKKMGIEP